jgi:tRNA (cmo5U34)-methyltransferase
MSKQDTAAFFSQEHANEYDKKFEKISAMRDALHLITAAVLTELPTNAHILCVGAGTGLEILALANRFPGWKFTAVEPSLPMLEVCRRRMESLGMADRCEFHGGYLNSLPATSPFDAATSLLVSHFILDQDARRQYFQEISKRLKPNVLLVNADLSAGVDPSAYEDLMKVWMRLMIMADMPPDNVEKLRAAYSKDVSLLPAEEVREIIASSGFEKPTQFLQTGLIHAWYARSVVR